MLSFDSQKVLVTGASSGIGKSVVRLLNDQGVRVVLCGRNFERLLEVKNNLASKSLAEIFVFDLEDTSNFNQMLSKSVENSGVFSGFVHCAGLDISKPYKLLKDEDFDSLFALNVTIPFELSRQLINKKHFRKSGGSLVWIGSVMGMLGQKGKIAYTSSKAAVEGLVRSFALELASRQIRVNTVAPGIVCTPLTDDLFSKLSEDQVEAIRKMHPLGFGEPRDVANLVAFLLSDQSNWITGSTYLIDGGYHIQ